MYTPRVGNQTYCWVTRQNNEESTEPQPASQLVSRPPTDKASRNEICPNDQPSFQREECVNDSIRIDTVVIRPADVSTYASEGGKTVIQGAGESQRCERETKCPKRDPVFFLIEWYRLYTRMVRKTTPEKAQHICSKISCSDVFFS